MPRTAPLLFDSISRNTGDIAIGIAADQLLAARGVSTTTPNPFDKVIDGPVIIGGGELIRDTGDPFYDAFRRTGAHILNASGVWTSADDLDYLNEYAFVSARSSRELEVLERRVPAARLLPCATTLLESPRYEIPGIEQDEPIVGIHLAPHAMRLIEEIVDVVDSIPYRKVFFPFTHYNGDRSYMKTMPFNMDNAVLLDELAPLQLHNCIGQMKYVLTTSLHASIFAYSQNVPFASVHQMKVGFYFADRGLSDHVVADEASLHGMLERFAQEEFDFTDLIASDRAAIETAFDSYAELVRSGEPSPAELQFPPAQGAEPSTEYVDQILLDQMQHVIGDRDLAIAFTESRRHALAIRLAEESERLASLQDAYTEARARLDYLASRWYFRIGSALRRVFARVLPGVFKRS